MAIADELFYHTDMYGEFLKKKCEPLEKFFGVTAVGFHYMHNENCLMSIHTNKKWIELCMAKKYFLDDPHMVSPKNIVSGFVLCSSCEQEEYRTGIIKDGFEYDMHHGISYVEKTDRGYKAFSFDTTKDNDGMPNKILNNQECIKKFVAYLDQELKLVFKKLSNRMIDIKELKGARLKEQIGITGALDEFDEKVIFLQEIGVVDKDSYLENLKLTPREISCLRYYLDGKTAEDTAKALFLSRRTVEGYIESIKIKLGCKYKKDIFNKKELLECLGII